MNDNYLWDKSGEPDEEIQHLESLLSEFRYQPRPLALPEAAPEKLPSAKPMIFSFGNLRYAALAAMALLALGAGIWLSVRPSPESPELASATPTPTASIVVTPIPEVTSTTEPQATSQPVAPASVRRHHTPKAHLAHHRPKPVNNKLLEEEGERAKEKVLYALQLTSEKLSLISRKIQTDTN